MHSDLTRWTLGTMFLAALWFASLLAVSTVGAAHGMAADASIHVAGVDCGRGFTASGLVCATDDPPPLSLPR